MYSSIFIFAKYVYALSVPPSNQKDHAYAIIIGWISERYESGGSDGYNSKDWWKYSAPIPAWFFVFASML